MDINGSDFYFGRQYDLAAKQSLADKLVLYDPTDLTTHAVITGMTGSGKTGMGIILLEEAALQGIPAILIDPNSTDSIAKAIEKIVHSQQLRRRLSQKGLEIAKKFSWQTTAKETLKVYHSVLS